MRILFSSTSGDGHLYPLLPLAQAMRSHGHEVAFAMADAYASRIEAAGLTWLAAGIGPEELNRRTRIPRDELAAVPAQHHIFVNRFALGDAPDRLAALEQLLASWRPDLVVFEPCDLAAPVAAAAAGLPTVLHSFGRALPSDYYAASGRFMAPLWRSAGLTPPALCGMYAGSYVDICPPVLQDQPPRVEGQVLQLRPAAPRATDQSPPWVVGRPERPTVYLTLGTIFNELDRFRLVLDAVEPLDCNLLVTIGRDNDPAALGPAPANTVIERFIPQDLVLPHVDVMVAHGGSGSMLAALAHGVPQLMLPAGADQFTNAAACETAGVARALQPEQATAAGIRQELVTLLRDQHYRTRAQAIGAQIASMPSPRGVAHAVTSRPQPSCEGAA